MGESGQLSRLSLAERLRPSHLDDLIGNPRAKADLRAWAESWREGPPRSRRAAVLSGPPGVGKTSAALALAGDLGWDVVEMNASDARNASAIEQIVGRAARLQSFGTGGAPSRRNRTLLLLDEADCLTGRLEAEVRRPTMPLGWREFLHGRYGSVEAVNAAWGLGKAGAPPAFEAWESVPRAVGRQRWASFPTVVRDLADWRASGHRPSDLTDRGGLGAIAALVRETRQPLVLTVNDEQPLTRYAQIFRNGVARIRFFPIPEAELRGQVLHVARREGFAIDARAIDALVARAHGDLRGALNDLEAIAPLPPGPGQVSAIAPRDRTGDLRELASEALASARFYRSTEVRDRTDSSPEDLAPWIEENIAHSAPDAPHRAAAFDVLSEADLCLSRARRHRVYSLWSFASELLTGGVGIALRERPVPPVEVRFPEFIGEMGRSKATRAVRDSIAIKLGHGLHLSRKKAREGALDLAGEIFRRASGGGASGLPWRNLARSVVAELDLAPEETAYLVRCAVDSPRAAALYEPREHDPNAAEARPLEPASRGTGQRSLSEFEP